MRLFLSLCVATLFLVGAQAADANAGDYGYRGHHGSSYSGSHNYRANQSYYRPQTTRYSTRYQVRPNYNYRSHYVAPTRSYYAPSYRRSCGGY